MQVRGRVFLDEITVPVALFDDRFGSGVLAKLRLALYVSKLLKRVAMTFTPSEGIAVGDLIERILLEIPLQQLGFHSEAFLF